MCLATADAKHLNTSTTLPSAAGFRAAASPRLCVPPRLCRLEHRQPRFLRHPLFLFSGLHPAHPRAIAGPTPGGEGGLLGDRRASNEQEKLRRRQCGSGRARFRLLRGWLERWRRSRCTRGGRRIDACSDTARLSRLPQVIKRVIGGGMEFEFFNRWFNGLFFACAVLSLVGLYASHRSRRAAAKEAQAFLL